MSKAKIKLAFNKHSRFNPDFYENEAGKTTALIPPQP
jgi:hypothetical protein